MVPNPGALNKTFRVYVDACAEPSGGSLHPGFRIYMGAYELPTGGHNHDELGFSFRVY